MDTLPALSQQVSDISLKIISSPLFPLVVIAAVLLFSIIGGVYFIITSPGRARRNVAHLMLELDAMTKKLNEAEHIGNFGSFTWDFENSEASFWSQEMYELTGLVPRKKPPTIEALIQTAHPDDRTKAAQEWAGAQTQPGEFSFVFRSVAPTGQVRYLRVQGKTVLAVDKLPRLIQGVAHDITKETEIDRAKSEFVSLASHQLKTPLTAVKWLSEALVGGSLGALSSQQEDYVKKVAQENQRMITMVNDLLNVSRLELGTLAIQLEEVDVCALLQEVYEEQRHTAETKHVAVKMECAPDLPHMQGDKNLMRMLFQNLLSNAIKYTPSEGLIMCDVSLGGLREPAISLRVADSGIGIPKSEQVRVFERLHRAKNARALEPDGTGLGLYMVKMIIDRAGGNITFESTEGKGTTFFVSLPLRWSVSPEAIGK